MSDDLDLIPIDEAARMLHRRPRTLRRWAERGRAPTGARLQVFRDKITVIRYFRRDQITAIRASIFEPEE